MLDLHLDTQTEYLHLGDTLLEHFFEVIALLRFKIGGISLMF